MIIELQERLGTCWPRCDFVADRGLHQLLKRTLGGIWRAPNGGPFWWNIRLQEIFWQPDRFFDVGIAEQNLVGVSAGRPVYLRDVSTVSEGPDAPESYVWMGGGPSAYGQRDKQEFANTLDRFLAKKAGQA